MAVKRAFYDLAYVDTAMAISQEERALMTLNDRQAAPAEPVTVTIDGARLTIAFPSGNSMVFRRSSRP